MLGGWVILPQNPKSTIVLFDTFGGGSPKKYVIQKLQLCFLTKNLLKFVKICKFLHVVGSQNSINIQKSKLNQVYYTIGTFFQSEFYKGTTTGGLL